MNDKMGRLEERFTFALLQDYQAAHDKLNYRASVYVGMVKRYGGVQTVAKLLGKSGGTYGLRLLQQEGRLDLSMEARMLDPEFSSLFSEDQLATARQVLHDLGYTPDQL